MSKAKILGKLKGVIASAKESSRNGRLYTEGFWDTLFGRPIFKEGLENRVFGGCLYHPDDEEEYSQIHLDDRSAVVLTDVKKTGLDYIGTFDILPTKAGQCLRNLLDVGIVFGVSSRGLADRDCDVFDENVAPTYDLITWDLVAFPGVKSCRLHEVGAVAESFKTKKNKTKIMENLNHLSENDKYMSKYINETLKAKEDFDNQLQIEDIMAKLGIPDDYIEDVKSANLVIIGEDEKPYLNDTEVKYSSDKIKTVVEASKPGDMFLVDDIYTVDGNVMSIGDWVYLTNIKKVEDKENG